MADTANFQLKSGSKHPQVIYVKSWRSPDWEDSEPSRPGWLVTCPEHGPLGKPPGWAYAQEGSARATATRHYRRWHLGMYRRRSGHVR